MPSLTGMREEPGERPTLDSLRQILSREDDRSIDIENFTRLIEDPELPADRVEGILLRHKSKSEGLLRKVLFSSSDQTEEHMQAFSLLTLILESEGKYQEEEAEMKKMIEASKSTEHMALAEASYGAFLENLGRTGEARIHYSKSVELCPTETQYLLDYANLLYERGEKRKAEKLVRRAISFLSPTDELRKYLKTALREGKNITPPLPAPSAGSLGRFMRTMNPDSLTKLIEEVMKRKELFPQRENQYLTSAKQSGDYIKAILDIEKDKEERRRRQMVSYDDEADDFTSDDDWEEWAVQNWITIINDWKPGFELYLNEIFFKDKCGTSSCNHPEGPESKVGLTNCPLDEEFDEYVFEVVQNIVKVAKSLGDLSKIQELQVPERIETIENRLKLPS